MDLRKLARFLVWTGLVLGVVLGGLRLLLFRTWTVPSDDPGLSASIAPTLAAGDLLVVLHAGTPGFGDLVRCTDPDEPRRWVIGRILGEGGDTVEISGSRVIINGRTAPLESACSVPKIQVEHPTTGAPVELTCDLEEVGGILHKRAYKGGENPHFNTPIKRTVQPGFFFLVSDNRALRSDSTTYGAVPVETCDARLIFRLWGSKGFEDVESRLVYIR